MSDTTGALLRRQPRQDRSEQRLELILDSLAALIDEVGYANLSIAMIAKRAEMSGPGIYRYFDDLNSIAAALAKRNLERFLEKATAQLADETEWESGIRRGIDVYSDMYRTEPGFRWLRLGDMIATNLINPEQSNHEVAARVAGNLFVERYEVGYREDLFAHIEVVIELIDSLSARAFVTDPDGEKFFLDEIPRIVVGYLDDYLTRSLADSVEVRELG